MDKYCENPLCLNLATKEVPVSAEDPDDQTKWLCSTCEETYTWGVQHGRMTPQGLAIGPPPQDRGEEPLYRVVYAIDVPAAAMREAAEWMHQIVRDHTSLPPVVTVIGAEGRQQQIDLWLDKDTPEKEG